jgi:hypothetical protein
MIDSIEPNAGIRLRVYSCPSVVASRCREPQYRHEGSLIRVHSWLEDSSSKAVVRHRIDSWFPMPLGEIVCYAAV